ncbi:D-lactate dehydrogenase [Paracoccus denitrificans]|jgi:D-lactate dehydrogenase|uniref:Quinone-dependent D-lactate dehydrogenase n=1 Tax=Paracoccus denitrificans (strain Pd 1222) TaxID=318586 RepID=A1B668_PARDP|nr:D-lactate dehydrogenase [Paracoccus denitrificans]ABL71012.1 D-lactate dehydrogenase [Paracoccus denitrificans PD1222]MBB4626668.1 D-lactate dehydrogenase [Paracoccus denitrificans]MCU7428689.1 D-lactate dehydrogenase [Paracoccus denitrificans]QAR27688.1 D-lactate dehydrogenase [Paracoccus denitrificans]UPV97376.1 D-lactate dehydrogenase [Paracoccus denitrificans]
MTRPGQAEAAADRTALLDRLRRIVGPAHVLTADRATRRYTRGFRYGEGPVAAVVRPGSLVQMWRVLNAAVASGRAVILQAANTGLTGGSTPWGQDYDREIVLVSVMRLRGIHLIGAGEQVLCLPGATLDALEKRLRPLGREPHSVIGSSCIGASVLGGICNNSGGALIQRGPAYTEMSLYAEVREDGSVALVNHLGLDLGDDPEEILARVEAGELPAPAPTDAWASDREYADHVRDIEAETPARFNADPRRLHESSGCAGKLAVFAVRLDTFQAEKDTAVFYVGSNDPDELTEIRRHILAHFQSLPIAGEYIHREAYDIAAKYGKDTFLFIRHAGTDRMPAFFAAKARMDALTERLGLGATLSDRLAQGVAALMPQHLPRRMNDFRDRYEHHLLLRMGGAGIAEARDYLGAIFPSASGAMFECTPDEGKAAFLHRFAVAGAAVRYRAIHAREVQDIVALDIALRRNDRDWVERLPPDLDAKLEKKLYYGHFFCHVFHQDYVVKKGQDCLAVEHEMWRLLDRRGAEYPAEHNVGHLYHAKPELAGFYRQLDPTNSLNPGIGQTSKCAHWH